MKPFTRALFVLLYVLALTSTSAGAAEKPSFSSEDLARRTMERRAVEAVIWGMPAVNYDLMRQEMLAKTSAKENEIVYWSRPADAKNQTLTPNPDAIYFMVFWNTKDAGPIVIEVPPADTGSLAANIDNIWQMPLADAGPEGVDQGKGGKYLILPPGYSGKPPAGYIVLQSDTYGGYALLRSNLESHSDADVAKATAYGKRIKVYPLSQAAQPPATRFTDAAEVLFDSTIRYDASFFENLNRIVQSEPWLQRDRAMIGQLKSIGIEKGKPFELDQKTRDILNAAVGEAHGFLAQKYDQGLPQYWPGSRWSSVGYPELVKATQTAYGDPDSYPVDLRGVTYTFGFIGIKRLGTAQFYLMSIKDKDGQDFDGSKTYRLTVPASVPVKQYWSATAYDRETHALLRNMPRASRASNAADLQKNADGSVDVYFGPRAPMGNDGNWVPTDPSRRFEVMFRLRPKSAPSPSIARTSP